jgi:hypothetical protein
MREITNAEWLALGDAVRNSQADSRRLLYEAQVARSAAMEERILSRNDRLARDDRVRLRPQRENI